MVRRSVTWLLLLAAYGAVSSLTPLVHGELGIRWRGTEAPVSHEFEFHHELSCLDDPDTVRVRYGMPIAGLVGTVPCDALQ